jgi:hypothetical protein
LYVEYVKSSGEKLAREIPEEEKVEREETRGIITSKTGAGLYTRSGRALRETKQRVRRYTERASE